LRQEEILLSQVFGLDKQQIQNKTLSVGNKFEMKQQKF
jgi:hypothetical protein